MEAFEHVETEIINGVLPCNGLSEFKVIYKHALKNSLIPVITYVGPMIAGLMTGSFVIERIFVINGIGKYFTESI